MSVEKAGGSSVAFTLNGGLGADRDVASDVSAHYQI
jgi:hypothetical protein